eukprot:183882-Amphidinium_carterae.2
MEPPTAAVPVPKAVPASLQMEPTWISSSPAMIKPSKAKAPRPELVEQKQNNPTSASASATEEREPIDPEEVKPSLEPIPGSSPKRWDGPIWDWPQEACDDHSFGNWKTMVAMLPQYVKSEATSHKCYFPVTTPVEGYYQPIDNIG